MSNLDSLRVHVTELGGDQAAFAELYRQLLIDSLEHGATDIHLQFAGSRVRVRYRVKGQLKLRCTLSLDTADGLFWAMKIHARMDIGERRRPQDGRGILQTSVGDRLIRVAIVPASQGPSATLRWIEEDTKCRQLHEIGLLPAQQTLVEEILKSKLGFVVVGSMGFSGRRTVGHAILLAAQCAGKSVLSLEWGVGRPIPGILQCDLSPPQSNLVRSQWIAAALRQNPDLLFIEHPDHFDAIRHVIAAARNDCLILASMGRSFEHLIEYLEWLDVPREFSTQTLVGGIEQRLLPRVCPNCAVSYTPKQQELRELGIQCDHQSDLEFVKSTGCLACHGTGRAGVVGVHEVAIMTDELRCMFRQKASDEQIRQQLLSEGMAPFYESALHKVVTRQIASTTVFAYLRMPKEPIKIDARTGLRCH